MINLSYSILYDKCIINTGVSMPIYSAGNTLFNVLGFVVCTVIL